MKPACELSVIVPAFREGASLHQAIPRILECMKQATDSYELLLIDDGSGDDTWKITCELVREHPEVRGFRLSRNYGKEAAICAGLGHCIGEAALVMDADLQHPPELIPEFYRLWKQGYDVVEGVKRGRRDEPFVRRHCARLFGFLARKSTGFDLRNSTEFKLMSREVIEAWSRMGESRLFFRGMVEWLGFLKAQVPFDVAPGVGRASTWPAAKLVRMGWYAIVSNSSAPLRIAHIIALGFIGFGLVLGMQTLYAKLVHRTVDGFTTVIVVLLLQGGLILGVLAIISEYLAAIYDEVKRRPRFLISETAGISAVSADQR